MKTVSYPSALACRLAAGLFLIGLHGATAATTNVSFGAFFFNPKTVTSLMCRHLLSVSWEGRLFDCDFNQALDLPLAQGLPQTIWEFELPKLAHRPIRLADHCYGCTAAAGSSCGGCLVRK